jgi:hypothetical protein
MGTSHACLDSVLAVVLQDYRDAVTADEEGGLTRVLRDCLERLTGGNAIMDKIGRAKLCRVPLLMAFAVIFHTTSCRAQLLADD